MTFKIGFHVSIGGGIYNSVDRAKSIGCTAFQIFTRNPRVWEFRSISEQDVDLFKSKLEKSGIQKDSIAVHTGFLINLSAPNSELYQKSTDYLTNELIRCSQLGIENLIIDLGSHLGVGVENGINQLINSCGQAADDSKTAFKNNRNVTVLLQNGYGQKNAMGNSIEELRDILDKLPKTGYGICLDTCHAFQSGYDLTTNDACERFIDKFDYIVGLNTVKFIHLNDSKKELGMHIDRHEHIGQGKIGIEGIRSIINNSHLRGLPMIIQTPIDSLRNDSDNLEVVLQLRKD